MVALSKIEKPFLEPHSRLGECPIYDSRTQTLAAIDIIGRKIHWYDYSQENVGATHKWVSTDSSVGVLGLTSVPLKFIAGVELGFALIDLTQAEGKGELVEVQYLHQTHTESDKLRFNDGVVDPKGRFFAGSMFTFTEDANDNGKLYRFDPDGSCKVVIENVGTPNGAGFSPDNKYFYATDSSIGTVFRYDYDIETGDISNQTEIIKLHAADAPKRIDPDGLVIDTDGNLWIAVWGDYKVHKYSPKGELLSQIELPANRVSCTTFAGPELNDLIVTTANLHLDDASYEWKPEEDRGGEIYRIKIDGVRGMDKNVFPLV